MSDAKEKVVTILTDDGLYVSGEMIDTNVALHVKEIGGAAGLVPDTYDYIELTYVANGNGVGEIETVTYKTGGASGSTVATLTLAYDSNNKLTSVTKS